MAFDLARARADTPNCKAILHLNNAGAALQPRQVLQTVQDHLRRESEIGGYEAADEAGPRTEAVYDSIARLLNAERDEIALVDNATRAFDMAAHALPLQDGDVVLASRSEYSSNVFAFVRASHDRRLELRYVDNEPSGELSLDALERELRDPRVKVVTTSHIPTQSGLVQPVQEIGRLAWARGVWFLLDATQSAGQLPLDVQAIGCDALAATGRKFLRGPRATGFLYVRRDRIAQMDPLPVDIRAASWSGPESYTLRPDARRFETWEQNVAGLLGLGAAVDYALEWGIDQTWERVHALAEGLRARLGEIPGVVVRDPGRERCGIVTFTVEGHEPGAIRAALAARPRRINVTASTLNSARVDFPERGLDNVVRASVHYYLTEADIEEAARAVQEIVAG